MSHSRDEVEAAVAAYVDLRERIGHGAATWTDLAAMFTENVAYIDPAWGRIDGIEELRDFLDKSMRGLDDWSFPIEYTAIDGDTVVIKWTQILPGVRVDGRPYTQSGYSTLRYAGGGKFDYEEDLLNMTHVLEDLAASGWQPPKGFVAPPARVDRNSARP